MRFFELIIRHPKKTIGVVVLVSLFFGWQMRKVELDNSIEELLPENHPSVVQDREIKHVFNSREMILIGVLREDGVFQPSTLQKIKELTAAAWEIVIAGPLDADRLEAWGEGLDGTYGDEIRAILSDGLTVDDRGPVNNLFLRARDDHEVEADFVSFLGKLQLKLSPLSDVISLAEVENITSSDFGLEIEPPMQTIPRTEAELADLTATVYGNEMFVDLLVSRDGTGTVILAELAFYYDDHLEMAYQVFERLEALAQSFRDPERIQLAGVPMVNVYTTTYMSGDMVKLTPLVIFLVMVVMYLSFRSLTGVFIPLSVVLAAIVWTLGIMGLVGRPVTLIVSFMPVMLIAIGIADGIHLITEYRILWAELRDHGRAILETMQRLARPVILTSLTTMAGFSALATSSLRSIRDFGVFTSIGVFAAMVFSLTFVPAALALMKPPATRLDDEAVAPGRLTIGLDRLGCFALRRRRWVYAGAVALTAISIAAATQITVGSTMAGLFKEESAIYQASVMVNEKFGGVEVMNIVIDTEQKDGLKDPVVLGKIAALQDTLESLDVVGYTSSLADYVKRTNLVMNGNDPAFNRLPRETEVVMETVWINEGGREVEVEQAVQVSGRDQIGQYLLLYENAGGDDLEKLADFDYSKANIIALIRNDFTPELRTVMRKAEAFAASNFGGNIQVTYAGCSTLCIVADDLIIPGQIRSLGVAFLVVLALLALIFRSATYGLLGLVPMVLTITVVFALLGVSGVYLDAASALIASIVLGIGVDYSIHFLARYRSLRRAGTDLEAAVLETLRTSGRAIVFNSLAVTVGFLVLLLSSFWPVIHMGWLVAANMVLSALLTMLVMPAVLASMEQHREAAAETPFWPPEIRARGTIRGVAE